MPLSARLRKPVIAAVGALTRSHPRLALALGDLISLPAFPLRHHSISEVRSLMPELSWWEAVRIHERAMRMNLRDQIVMFASQKHLARLHGILTIDETLRALRGPAILATFHTGPIGTFELAGNMIWNDFTSLRAYGRREDGATAFLSGSEVLRRGGVVGIAVDARHGSRVPTTWFGREVLLARGAFALARSSGAPIIPLLLVWRGLSIELVTGDPILPATSASIPAIEKDLADQLMAWLERHMKAHPSDLALRAIKRFKLPRSESKLPPGF